VNGVLLGVVIIYNFKNSQKNKFTVLHRPTLTEPDTKQAAV